MAWLAVDADGSEWIYGACPNRGKMYWEDFCEYMELPRGSIKKLTGRELTWSDEPYELK